MTRLYCTHSSQQAIRQVTNFRQFFMLAAKEIRTKPLYECKPRINDFPTARCCLHMMRPHQHPHRFIISSLHRSYRKPSFRLIVFYLRFHILFSAFDSDVVEISKSDTQDFLGVLDELLKSATKNYFTSTGQGNPDV
jgi:hypothetical protein